MPHQWRNYIWHCMEEGAGKRCSECEESAGKRCSECEEGARKRSSECEEGARMRSSECAPNPKSPSPSHRPGMMRARTSAMSSCPLRRHSYSPASVCCTFLMMSCQSSPLRLTRYFLLGQNLVVPTDSGKESASLRQITCTDGCR